MPRITRVLLTLLAFAPPIASLAEEKPCEDLEVHIVKNPVFPPIALAARFSGRVTMKVTISAEAKITGIESIEGPELLRGNAKDYVSNWDLGWQQNRKHHVCVESVIVDYKIIEQSKSISSFGYEIVTEDGLSSTILTARPATHTRFPAY